MSQNELTTSAVTECLTNIEVVKNICKYLNYDQQLQLSQVSRALEQIIVDFVWKTQFKEVEIYIFNKTNFFVSDKIYTESRFTLTVHFSNFRKICKQKKLLLQRNNVDNFLCLNARNVKKLHFKYYGNQRRNVRIYPFLKQNFINLTYLRFERATLTSKDLQKVASNCLKLETLVFFSCFHRENQPLILDDLHIQTIKKMSNLKNLLITVLPFRYRHLHSFSNVRKILNELKLQRVKLSFISKPDTSANEINFNFNNLKYCKVFEIGTCKKSEDFLKFQFKILPKFENLCNLTLHSATITETFFNILTTSCKILTYLTLIFCRIKYFKALPKLRELILYCCKNLTCFNLKTILHEMHLKCFRTINTSYKGDLELFLIAPTLEKLYCDFTEEKLVKLLKFNTGNLRNLSHITWEMHSLEDFTLRLSGFAPNLKVLCVRRLHLSVNDCYQMILKHENLRELTIEGSIFHNLNVDFSKVKAFETNLLYLNISGQAFHVLKDFCLDLLKLNNKLSLTCFKVTTDIILSMINNENFPSRFKSINVCGFTIDCVFIRNNNCIKTLDFIKFLVNVFEIPNEKCFFALE